MVRVKSWTTMNHDQSNLELHIATYTHSLQTIRICTYDDSTQKKSSHPCLRDLDLTANQHLSQNYDNDAFANVGRPCITCAPMAEAHLYPSAILLLLPSLAEYTRFNLAILSLPRELIPLDRHFLITHQGFAVAFIFSQVLWDWIRWVWIRHVLWTCNTSALALEDIISPLPS